MKIKFEPNNKGYLVITILLAATLWLAFKKRNRIKQLAVDTINYLKEKTWDIATDRRIDSLHPLVQDKAKEFIIRAEKELGIKLRISSAMRTWEEQNELYAKGRTAPGRIVTNAKAGESFHNYGLAIDVVEIKDGKAIWNNPRWEEISDIAKQIGFQWGGDWKTFKDKPHFHYSFGKSLAQLRKLYSQGKRDGEYVKLVA